MADSRGGWRWLTISVLLVSFAQLALKYAMQHLPAGQGLEVYLAMLRPGYFVSVDLPVALGLMAYIASVLCWIGTLSRLPLSMAYPALALSYLFVYFGAVFLPMFAEQVDPVRLLGIALVIFGVWLVSRP